MRTNVRYDTTVFPLNTVSGTNAQRSALNSTSAVGNSQIRKCRLWRETGRVVAGPVTVEVQKMDSKYNPKFLINFQVALSAN